MALCAKGMHTTEMEDETKKVMLTSKQKLKQK